MKKVYIVLSQTGTIISKTIRWYTKDPYSHVSISFDSSLADMYSFGRKQRYNIFNGGFLNENFNKGMFSYFPDTYCCVFEISVTDLEYKAMYEAVNLFCTNRENYSYNMIGVLGYIVGIKLSRKDHFFCSQFVSYILNKADFWDTIPELTKPMDFCNLPNKRLVFEGSIREFRELHLVPSY